MNTILLKIVKRLAFCGTFIGLMAAGIISAEAQGIGFQFTATSYSAVMGQPVSGSVSMVPISDPYNVPTDDYGDTEYYYYDAEDDTYYYYVTDWYEHLAYSPATANVLITDSDGDEVASDLVGWSTGATGNQSFSFTTVNPGAPGADFVGLVWVDDSDPYYFDPDDFAYYCYPNDSDGIGYYSTVYTFAGQNFTNYNPNTVMSAQVVGPSTLTEGPTPNSTIIQVSRADSYNTRTVHYTISGDAVNGDDYTATLGGTITIPAGSTSANISISTLADADLLDLDEPSTLTVTLISDSMGTYQLGANITATITFQNEPDDIGTAQLTRTTNPSFDDQNIGYAKNSTNSVSRSYTNNLYSSSSAILSVFASSPYASGSGPTSGEFTIVRSGWISNSFTLSFSVSGTAGAGTNFAALPTTISFAANQTSTNLLVNVLTNAVLTNAQTVVFNLNSNSSYFLGYSTQAVVTILPLGATTNSVASPSGRYVRGNGSDPTYWSQVIPLDAETGPVYSNLNGNCSSLYPGLSAWSTNTLYHFSAVSGLSQTNITNRIAFNNPVVAFGERVGGTPLYFNQDYAFGIYAGDPVRSNLPVVIQAYYRTNLHLAGSINLSPPNYFNNAAMAVYATNGFQVTTNAFGLTTTLSDSPGLSWGTTSLGAYVLTQNATSQASI